MSLPPLLKSKFFWSFSLVAGGASSAVAYDRYEAHCLRESFMAEAREYGREPLPLSEQPRCLSFFLLSPSATDHRATRQIVRSHALDLLTAAGVDYRWVVEVDGEEAKGKWDEAARERNEPELMREQQSIPLEELKSNILLHVLQANLNGHRDSASSAADSDKSHQLWESLRSVYTQNPATWPSGSGGFVAVDSVTAGALQAALSEPRVLLSAAEPVKPAAKSWWSRAVSSPPAPAPAASLPLLYQFPCTLSQSPLSRLQRFLFGQREVTRAVGEAVLQCIREAKAP